MENPLVSIITPAYNSQKFIAFTIQSVQEQLYPHWEMLIIDDASTDNTCSLVEQFARTDARIKLISLKNNSGAGVARNRGIEEASGTYITFLDADDVWLPHKLQTQVGFMEENNAFVSFSSYSLMDEQGVPLHTTIKALPIVTYNKMLKSNYIGNLTGMYNAGVLGKMFMPLIRKRQDWGLWLGCIRKAGVAYGIPDSLACYRVRKDSISSNKWNLLAHNYIFYRKALNFGVLKSGVYLALFLMEHFFVKSRQTEKNT